MKDFISEALLMFFALATIVVMILIIVKERRKQKAVDTKKAKDHVKRKLHTESTRVYID
jgi:hypothetical protein